MVKDDRVVVLNAALPSGEVLAAALVEVDGCDSLAHQPVELRIPHPPQRPTYGPSLIIRM
jgi:hypothetical protein